jgi:ribosome biogenesis GTPase
LTLQDYGIVPNTENLPGIPARVVAQHRDRYEIVCEYGAAYARLKTKDSYWEASVFPTVGDYVAVNDLTGGDSQILSTLPRHSCFSRREPGPIPRNQAVAANFDYVFVLQSMNQNYNPRRLERYLILARQSGARKNDYLEANSHEYQHET